MSLVQGSPSHEESEAGRATAGHEAEPAEGTWASLGEEAVPMRDPAELGLDREREDRVQAIVGSKPRRRLSISRPKAFAVASTIAFLALAGAVLALSRDGGGKPASPKSATTQASHDLASSPAHSPSAPAGHVAVGEAMSLVHRRPAAVHPKRERAKHRAKRARAKREKDETIDAAQGDPVLQPAPSPAPTVEEPAPVVEAEPTPEAPSSSSPPPAAESQAQEQFGFER